MKILDMLLVEAFMSIHISICILWPLAEHINPNKKKEKFIELFFIRVIILLFGNLMIPFMPFIDFAVFFIGFIIMNKIAFNKVSNTEISSLNHNTTYTPIINPEIHSFAGDITPTTNFKLNLSHNDREVLGKEFYDIFIKYKNSYSKFNYDALKNICTDSFYQLTSQELFALKKNNTQNLFTNFKLNKIVVNNFNQKTQSITTTLDVSFNDYKTNITNSQIVSGSRFTNFRHMFKIIFIPSESNSNIAKDCPNCGAPIDSDLRACEYCLTPFKDSKIVWKISSIVTTYKEI